MSLIWWLQIAADALLIAAVLVLILRMRSGKAPAPGASAAELELFIKEAKSVSQEFDRILGEKRQLVRTTLKALDERIAQLEKNKAELAPQPPAQAKPKPAPAAPAAPAAEADGMEAFRRKVLELSRKGQKPAQIAQATGRPRGEVELVLGLNGR